MEVDFFLQLNLVKIHVTTAPTRGVVEWQVEPAGGWDHQREIMRGTNSTIRSFVYRTIQILLASRELSRGGRWQK